MEECEVPGPGWMGPSLCLYFNTVQYKALYVAWRHTRRVPNISRPWLRGFATSRFRGLIASYGYFKCNRFYSGCLICDGRHGALCIRDIWNVLFVQKPSHMYTISDLVARTRVCLKHYTRTYVYVWYTATANKYNIIFVFHLERPCQCLTPCLGHLTCFFFSFFFRFVGKPFNGSRTHTCWTCATVIKGSLKGVDVPLMRIAIDTISTSSRSFLRNAWPLCELHCANNNYRFICFVACLAVCRFRKSVMGWMQFDFSGSFRRGENASTKNVSDGFCAYYIYVLRYNRLSDLGKLRLLFFFFCCWYGFGIMGSGWSPSIGQSDSWARVNYLLQMVFGDNFMWQLIIHLRRLCICGEYIYWVECCRDCSVVGCHGTVKARGCFVALVFRI